MVVYLQLQQLFLLQGGGKSVTITSNPGKDNLYSYEIIISVPSYSVAYENRSLSLGIYDKTINIIQTAANSTFSITQDTLTFAAQGSSSQTMSIVSNDNWTLT